MGVLFRLGDFYRARGIADPNAKDEGDDRANSREQGLWVIICALVLALAVVGVFSFTGPRSTEGSSDGPTNLHVALTQAER